MNNLDGNRSTFDQVASHTYDIGSKTQFLTLSGKSKTKYICPVCDGKNLDINPPKYHCFTNECDTKDIRAAIDQLEGKHPDDWKKPSPARQTSEYFYPNRAGEPLVKVVRQDNGAGKKKFFQSYWGGQDWKKGNPQGVRSHIPIYRYPEVQKAIEQNQHIYIVEGEKAADALWALGIPATTTIGGSGGYKTYGDYSSDLKGARLILAPDRDNSGLKYVANFQRDFADQIEGYCLAGEIEGWSKPTDGRDLADDILDRHVTKTTILESLVSIERFNDICFSVNSELKSLLEAKDEPEKEDKKTISERVLLLAFAAEYFCTPDKVTYADVRVDGCRETHNIRSRAFKLWITSEFYDSEEKAINANAMAEVLGVLDARAIRSKIERDVFIRTAEHQGKIYVDLGSPNWSAVEIDAQGWRIVAEPPIRFTRPESLLALPMPVLGGSLSELKDLINAEGKSWVLIITFLLFCFCPNKTYPVLVLAAHRGNGKTAAAEILKGLVDPGKGGLPGLPNNESNLAARAVNRWLMAYDNVGYLSPEMSDLLCRMATKFGYSTRTLFTTIDETTTEFTRPQLITAIDALITRDDLASRVLMAQLDEITEEKRLPQSELNLKVAAARPRILGALLTALSQTLAALPNTKPDRLPRMADYGLFSIAAEKALGLKPGEFMEALDKSAEQSRQIVIESSPIGEAILKLMEHPANSVRWKGTASQLLNSLESFADEGTVRSRHWPKASNTFKRQLNRLIPDLKKQGILISETTYSGTKLLIMEQRKNIDTIDTK
jgi:nucleotide-binding universal stress UspA family protein